MSDAPAAVVLAARRPSCTEAVALLLRAARVAATPSLVLLGVVGTMALRATLEATGSAPGESLTIPSAPPGPEAAMAWTAEALRAGLAAVLEPWSTGFQAFLGPFGPATNALDWLRALGRMLLVVVTLTLLGGAVVRVASHVLAGRARPGLTKALGFSFRKADALIGAPLSPLIGIGSLALLSAVLGLAFRLPAPVGTVLGAIAALPALALAIPMAVLAIGLAIAWPLMTATVGVEGEDTFDALSRAYGYAIQRPARLGGLAAGAALVGTLGWIATGLFAGIVLRMCVWALAAGQIPPALEALVSGPEADHRWRGVVGLIAQGWAFAFFFAAATAIYLLLREDVDGTPRDERPAEPAA